MNKYAIIIFLFLWTLGCMREQNTVDLLLINGNVWSGALQSPRASWLAIQDGKIYDLGNQLIKAPPSIDTIDLEGQFVIPGFNDSHVHFASAGALLLGINLLDVNDDESFVQRIQQCTQRMPEGAWITRGDWGAYEAWEAGSTGGDNRGHLFEPHRSMIDPITPDHPVLVTKYDRTQGMANHLALEQLGILSESGILEGEELTEALRQIPGKGFDQLVAEAERAFAECRKWGLTTVQDMSPLHMVEVYRHLAQQGKMTCRISFSPSRLTDYEMMTEKGWIIQNMSGPRPAPKEEGLLSFGTMKTHIDGIMGARTARFYGPYTDNPLDKPDWRGGWREFSKDMPSFKEMLIATDAQDIQLRVHAIGDEANRILLDILDTLESVNGVKERRFRLVHAQVISPEDFSRFKGKNIVAEIQPYHVTDDMRWMEERIGKERCAGAYAFRTLLENGCLLSFGSDWPGTNASYYPINPLMGLYAAVTRQTTNSEPEGGWFPKQKLSLEESLKAYTYGSAFGAFEEHLKGTLEKGKYADITVLDTDLFNTIPNRWLQANVSYTIVGGKVVYKKPGSS